MPRFTRKRQVNNFSKRKKNNNGLAVDEQIFSDEWLKDRNGTEAYKVAHPGTKNDNVAAVSAHAMLKRSHVALYINKKLDKMSAIAQIDQEWVLSRLKKLVDFNIKDYMDDEGNLKPLSEIPEDVLFAAHGFKSLKQMIKEGKNGKTKITSTLLHDLKFSDKKLVLDSIGRYLGMFEKDNLQKVPKQINVTLVD